MNLGDKIRSMSELLTSEEIAKAIEIPEELVKGVLSGDIPDSVLDEYDPEKPPEIRIVEQKRFLRSRSIGIIGTSDIKSSILAAYLAVGLAKKAKYNVALADFKELSTQKYLLGIGRNHTNSINFAWGNEERFTGKGNTHHIISNLAVFMGAAGVVKYQEMREGRLVELLSDLNNNYSAVIVDCPSGVNGWEELMSYLDIIIVDVEQNNLGISKYCSIYTYLYNSGKIDKTLVVLSGNGQTGNMSAVDTKRAILNVGNVEVIGELPYDPSINRDSAIFSKTNYSDAIEKILGQIFPETIEVKKKGILKSILERI